MKIPVRTDGTFGTPAKFTPDNVAWLNAGDVDLAAGGPVLLPGGALIGGGKEGVLYLLDTASMAPLQFPQGFQGAFYVAGEEFAVPTFSTPNPVPVPFSRLDLSVPDCYPTTCSCTPNTSCSCICRDPAHDPGCGFASPRPNVFLPSQYGVRCSIRPSAYKRGEGMAPNIHGGPAFFQFSSTRGFIYIAAEKDNVRGFLYDIPSRTIVCGAGSAAGQCAATLVSSSVLAPDGMPGGALSVSSNGLANGIVWDLQVKIDVNSSTPRDLGSISVGGPGTRLGTRRFTGRWSRSTRSP